jgi:hypothetical protein
MTGYEFIFSNKPGKRLYRHFVFWGVLALHFIIQNLMVGGANEALKDRSFVDSAFNALFFFPVYLLSVYIFIYMALPFYLSRRRYLLFFCWIACLLILDFIGCLFSGALYIHVTSHIPFNKITFDDNKYNAVVNGLFLPLALFGVSGGIKLTKKWYLEQNENQRLAKEKISRELQLLKTQLHPRFLFHSLHTIKKHIQLNSTLAASLILHLSDLLSYILYESDQEWVLLEKELELIKSYIDLEKKSSKDRLAIEINISGVTSGKYISPLLLLSVIENSFDFFLKDNENDPSLQLMITVWDNHLDYHLICNRFLDRLYDPPKVKLKFIDLEKQLNYVYADLYQFEVYADKQTITIILNVPVYDNNTANNEVMVTETELHELL